MGTGDRDGGRDPCGELGRAGVPGRFLKLHFRHGCSLLFFFFPC